MAAQIRRQAEREAAMVRRDAAEWASTIRREAEDRLRDATAERADAADSVVDLSDDDHPVLHLGDFDPSGLAQRVPAHREQPHDSPPVETDEPASSDEPAPDPLAALVATLPSPPVGDGVPTLADPVPTEPEVAPPEAEPSPPEPDGDDDPYERGRLVALGSLLESSVFDRPIRPTGVAADRLPRRRAGDVIDLGRVVEARRRAQERRDDAAATADARIAVQHDPVETSIETRVHDIVRLAVRRTFPRRTS